MDDLTLMYLRMAEGDWREALNFLLLDLQASGQDELSLVVGALQPLEHQPAEQRPHQGNGQEVVLARGDPAISVGR